MRCVVAERFGGPEVLELVERARPEPGLGEARVQVLAAGVAYPDLLMREGAYLTPGYDIVGRVDALGPGAAGSAAGPRLGQTVAALIEHGGYAEQVCVPGARLVLVPDGLDPAEAVGLILNYTTAWQALFRVGRARRGARVLVHGAGGGVGTAALQIGQIQGLDSYGTASAAKRKVVERLGGTHMDYRSEDFGRRLLELTGDGVDVVLDSIGGQISLRSFRALRRGGRLVLFGHHSVLSHGRRRRGRMAAWYASVVALWLAGLVDPRRSVRGYRIQKLAGRRPDWFREDLGRLFGFLAERRIEPLVAGRLPLEAARRAHELLAEGRVEGKLVLIPEPPDLASCRAQPPCSPERRVHLGRPPGVACRTGGRSCYGSESLARPLRLGVATRDRLGSWNGDPRISPNPAQEVRMNPDGKTTKEPPVDHRPPVARGGTVISRRRFMAAGAAALSVPLFARPAAAQAKVLRISTPGSPDEWQSKALVKFKEELDKNAAGQFTVQLHYNGTLFAQGTEIEAMQRGNLEGALTSPQDITNLIPEYSIFTTGYLMRGPAHLDAVYDGDIGAEYKARVAKQVGIQIVRSQYLGTRHVILRQLRNVRTPADMAGLKLRMPGSETWQFMGASLGANPTPLAFEEVYLAMQTGTVDGLENPLPDAMAAKFYEVSKQVVLTAHMVSNVFFSLAGGFWNGLSLPQQKAIEAAVAVAKKLNDDGVIETEKTAASFFEGKGVKVTTPDVAAFRTQVQKRFLDSKFAKTWPPGMLDRINKAGS